MTGKLLMSGLIAIALAIGAGIYYSATIASYDEVRDVDQVRVGETSWGVSNYRGIDGETSPLKLRACFDFELPYVFDATHADDATPLVTPGWFDCFDAVQIEADLRTGDATAIISTENEPFGFTTFIAHYPDGRGYLWRQINACGTAQFAGSELPDGCPNAANPEDALFAKAAGGGLEDLRPFEGSVRGRGGFACFETPLSLGLITETFFVPEAVPILPEGAPPCFTTDLTTDIVLGRAVPLVGADPNQYMAVYPNGRGFVWTAEE
ncbi:MAG: DUF6446 family protein [Pseudomonadota bacterium]